MPNLPFSARSLLVIPLASLMLSGCIAKTAIGVVTAPVRMVSQAADWATVSQDEADRSRGREIRQREEQLGQLQGDYNELADDCADGSDRACRRAVTLRREIDELLPSIPVEPYGG